MNNQTLNKRNVCINKNFGPFKLLAKNEILNQRSVKINHRILFYLTRSLVKLLCGHAQSQVNFINHSFVAAVTFGQLGGRSYDMHICFESQVADITIFFRLILIKADKM